MSSLYYETLYAWKCKGTHHKLALDSLNLLSLKHADRWQNLFLRHAESYLTGSKDPDKKFKDFRNHVLHVGDHFWGGAVKATLEWYDKSKQAFAAGRWERGVYSAGVMGHYLTDVFCPLHTGQSEKENTIHRACEWSVSCSYDDLFDDLHEDLGGFPDVQIPQTDNWLEMLIKAQAEQSYRLYDLMVHTYDFNKGVKDPPAGLGTELAEQLALTIGRAIVTLAAVLDRCLAESTAKPPSVSLSLHTLLAQVTIPVFWITQKMDNAAERKIVTRIYKELQATGRVEKNLPAENRVIRDLVAQREASKKISVSSSNASTANEDGRTAVAAAKADRSIEQKPRIVVRGNENASSNSSASTASQPGSESIPESRSRLFLTFDSPIVDAPSIGPKTAARFDRINLNTVHDLLTTPADKITAALNTRWITTELVTAWQQQAELMCSVPELRGHDAQLLQGVGVENYLDLAHCEPSDLLPLIDDFAATTEGQRILRSGKSPDLAEVSFWIDNARAAARNQAA